MVKSVIFYLKYVLIALGMNKINIRCYLFSLGRININRLEISRFIVCGLRKFMYNFIPFGVI